MKEEQTKYTPPAVKGFPEIKYVVHTTEGLGSKWKIVTKKDLLMLNPHDVVSAYELGKEIKLSVCIN